MESEMPVAGANQYSGFSPFLAALAVAAMATFSPPAHAALVADVIFINGQFETLNSAQPRATAVAVKDEKFIAIGTNEDIKATADTKTLVIDLSNEFVAPGFVDGHTHPMETIWIKDEWVDARFPGTQSVKQALEKITETVVSG